MDGVGDQFQEETKYYPDRMGGGGLGRRVPPAPYKEYHDAVRVELPAFEPSRPMSLDAAIRARKSVREFAATPIGLGQLSYLLWASAGVQRTEHGYAFRTAPSAGALYPIETYLVVNDVGGLEQGLYHYAVASHQLERLQLGDFHEAVAAAALGQGMCAAAPVVFVWSAIFERSKWKYRQRAYRYVYLDAGHIAENLALATVSLGLGSCQIGALFDDECNRLFDLDGVQESVIYMSVVGVPR